MEELIQQKEILFMFTATFVFAGVVTIGHALTRASDYRDELQLGITALAVACYVVVTRMLKIERQTAIWVVSFALIGKMLIIPSSFDSLLISPVLGHILQIIFMVTFILAAAFFLRRN